MGVLDDAIREHLDLKRRHGVGEDELRRQEEEALGPARREVAPTEAEDGEAEPAAAEAAVEAEVQERVPAAADDEELVADEPEPELELEPEELEPEPEPLEAAIAPGETPPRGFEPIDEDEPLAAEEGEEEAEDVLEDTPDFLQETPEHDRLWFEQKPPRDFDFD